MLERACVHARPYRGDIRKIDALRDRYDVVCHLAALNKARTKKETDSLFDVNVNGTDAVMRYCRRKKARCVFASSSAVYEPTADEKLLHENSSAVGPVSVYGISKVAAEGVCRYYAENFGVSATALRIFNMYGPGQKAPFLVPDIVGQLAGGKPLVLRTPKAIRDFVYVEDVAGAFLLACGLDRNGFLALNVGTGKGMSVYNVAGIIAGKMKKNHALKRLGRNAPKTDYVLADIRRTRRTLGWRPEIDIEEGLDRVIGGSRRSGGGR
jgi:UDP-glucose 4-epimerase